jgi:hypothetical protein
MNPPRILVHCFLAAVTLLSAATVAAEIPRRLNYQGRVSVAGENFTGSGQFKFALISADSSTAYWKNSGAPGGTLVPQNPVSLPVTNGHYSIQLGDTTIPNMQSLPASIFADHGDLMQRVWFNDGINGFEPLLPDQRVSTPVFGRSHLDRDWMDSADG